MLVRQSRQILIVTAANLLAVWLTLGIIHNALPVPHTALRLLLFERCSASTRTGGRMDKADLELLGYSSKWVEYGYLTPEFLLAQVARFHTGDDKCTEHYRGGAFKLLRRRATLSVCDFEHYVELATLDPDPGGLGTAALINLIHYPGLTDEQLEALYAHPYIQKLPRLVTKWRLLKALREASIPIDTLQRCVDEGDSGVHRALLELPDLPRSIVEALHHHGGNKAVRNIARVRLKNDRYRAPK
jgi:hypothetical protein